MTTTDAHPDTRGDLATSTSDAARPDLRVLRWLVAATFIVILNETVMINAIPRLMGEFGVTARSAQWLSTAFMLTTAVVIPVTGWFLQRVTTRRAFSVAMATFCAGTLVAALAPTFGVLLAGRVVQAAGTAIMMPLLMTTLMTIVPERDRGRVMGHVTLAMSVAPALGPAVSGVVLQVASWRWMFGLVLPVAAAIAVLGLRRLTDVGETRPGSVDVTSVLLAAVGFGGFVYGLSQVGAEASVPVPAGWLIAGGAAAIALFVGRQVRLQRSGTPLLDLRTLRHPTYAVALTMMAVGFMAMIGSMMLLPLYLQDVRGLSALQAGLLVAPGGLAMGLLGPTVGRVLDRHGSGPLVVPGALAVLVAMVGFARVGTGTPVVLVLAAHVLLMVGLAAMFTPAFTLGLGALPMSLYSHGSSLLGASQQVAAAIGTAVVITVMSSRSAGLEAAGQALPEAMTGGLRAAFWVGAALAAVTVALAVALTARRPAAPRDAALSVTSS